MSNDPYAEELARYSRRQGENPRRYMMGDRHALEAAAVANPADDLPALVLADYLDENGHDRAATAVRQEVGRGVREPDPERDDIPEWVRAAGRRMRHLAALHPSAVVRAYAGQADHGNPLYSDSAHADTARVLRMSADPRDAHRAAWLDRSDTSPEEAYAAVRPVRFTPLQRRFHETARYLTEGGRPLATFSGKVVGGEFRLFDHHPSDADPLGFPRLFGTARTARQMHDLVEHARGIDRERVGF